MTSHCYFSKKQVDRSLSIKVAKAVDARHGECVSNVSRAILDYPDVLPKPSYHVEGFWYIGGQFYGHTWIETEESIIDPTLVSHSVPALTCDVMYFPVICCFNSWTLENYGNKSYEPGIRLDMMLNRVDPAVEAFEREYSR